MNMVFLAGFTYPEGMAPTKRVQRFIDYFIAQGVIPKVLIIQNKKSESGYHTNIEYKKVRFFRFFYLFKILLKWKQKKQKNILYVFGGFHIKTIIAVLFAKFLSYKIITDKGEDYEMRQEKISFLGRARLNLAVLFFEKYICSLSDGIVVISTHLKKKFDRLSNGRIPVVHIPIGAVIRPKRVKERFHRPVKIVYTGSFGGKDGIDVLLKAFKIILEKRPDSLLLLSGKPDKHSHLQEMLQAAKNPKVEYVGYLRDKEFYKFLDDADILCATRSGSPYAQAGFPFKLGEYLATGNPVIASRVSDVEQYLGHGIDAVLVEPDSAESLKDAMEYLLDDEKRALEIGARGREKCMKYFNPETNGALLQRLIDQI